MGINSTEVAYGFGQLGSGFCDSTGTFAPPAGRVIIAIQFMADTTLEVLVADTVQIDGTPLAGNTGFFSHTAPVAVVHGSGSDPTNALQVFPKGLTIFGRWTSVALSGNDPDGGMICYFGE